MNPTDSAGRRRRRLTALAAVAAVAAGLLTTALAAPAAGAATGPTYVSLTFDDSNADQAPAEQTMKTHGLTGTFYTVDSWIGASGYLTRSDLSGFAADGNEIGGHTVTHPDLTAISGPEAQRQICDNRATLQSWGFKPVDFAYPFSTANASVENLVKNCGYNTARGLGDVRSPASCRNCVFAETTPPPDPYYLRAPDEVDATWTLAQMKREVTQAVNHGGGWVILSYHHVCAPIGSANCPADLSTTPAIFNAFVKWLANYADTAANRTSVRTVDQVVRQYLGANYPPYQNASPVPPTPPAPVGTDAVNNPSLESTDPSTGFPTCFQPGGWGSNTAAWAVVSPGHTGSVAEQLTLTNYVNGDAKLLPTLDLGACSPTVTPGTSYDLGVWYQSTGTTQFALYYRDSSGAWYYWTSSPWFAAATGWTQASYTTPPVPTNAVGITFGFALISNGTLVTDDYSMVDPGTTTATLTAAARTLSAVMSAAAPATRVTVPSAKQRPERTVRVHSHQRPYLPGGKGARGHQKIAVPELVTGTPHRG